MVISRIKVERIRKEFTKEINKVKPSMKSIPFISVYNLTERTERSFSKIKLFASDISLLTFVVFPIAEEVNNKFTDGEIINVLPVRLK